MGIILKSDLTNEHLTELFNNEESCLNYISTLKWENGFTCRKCGNNNYCAGKTPYSRRCTRCKNEESAIAHTIFHNCKFDINKAFFIVYHVSSNEESSSSYDFAKQLDVRQMTCWKFKKKINDSLDRSKRIRETNELSIEEILLSSTV